MVAIGMNGEPLPLEHGFPARMVTPGLYGYVSATKWLVDLEVTRFADFKAYWTTRGYSAEAPIKTSSRIDVPRSFAQLEAGPNKVGRRRVGPGLRHPEGRGPDRRWRLAGGRRSVRRTASTPGVSGSTTGTPTAAPTPSRSRATDRTGFVQTGKRAPIAPDGSTGWDSKSVTVS